MNPTSISGALSWAAEWPWASIFSVIISGVALFVSIFTYRNAAAASHANTELYINERISNTREFVTQLIFEMTPLMAKKETKGLNEEEKVIMELHSALLHSAIENNLNAYDNACGKYLDSKVDKDRFKIDYKKEISQLYSNDTYATHLKSEPPQYESIMTVYNEWCP